jgi:hypothetical protein
LKSVFGSSDLARIELAPPDPICRVSPTLIKHVTLSLRNIEHGRDKITDFIVTIPPCAADISYLRLAATDPPPRYLNVGFRLRFMGGLQRLSEPSQCGIPHTAHGKITEVKVAVL